ncbi:hypothetical protein [Pantanalinema sp. GBBB05]|uniref:hypothetical protein n=1 Tax=Pantanalinema sp. GBBB05 TaxID=2604139 RepID=UPI003D817980
MSSNKKWLSYLVKLRQFCLSPHLAAMVYLAGSGKVKNRTPDNWLNLVTIVRAS